MLVYFDQNPYDALLDGGVTTEKTSAVMRTAGHTLIVSGDNLQEWASCWKSGNPATQERGRELVRFMLGIRPRRLLIPLHQLILREIRQLFGEKLRGPFLPVEDLPGAEALLERFAEGAPTDADLERMLDHWQVKDVAGARADEQATRWKERGVESAPDLDALIGKYPEEWKSYVRVYVESAETAPVAGPALKRVMRHLDECPALRAAARSDFYITWRVATGKRMQHDRWDDLRHCINSSYTGLFVTKDADLRKAFEQIEPGPKIVTVSEFTGEVDILYSGP